MKNSKIVRPITPDEVVSKKRELFPKEVIESFNEMIAEKWDGKSSRFQQKDVISRIREKTKLGAHDICEKGYLDVEEIFEKAGWKVDYDRPGYNESYEPVFEFTKK